MHAPTLIPSIFNLSIGGLFYLLYFFNLIVCVVLLLDRYIIRNKTSLGDTYLA
jgi:hypothetical protein